MTSAKDAIKAIIPTQNGPPERCRSPGVLLCLLALAVPVKPLAHAVADYARSDRHKECDQEFHHTHLLPVARNEKGSGVIVPYSDNLRNL